MTRNEAIELGETLYNTGKPCKAGHLCDRWVANYTCVECHKLIAAKTFQKHKEARSQTTRQWIKANPDKRKVITARYYQNNRDRLLANRDKSADLARLNTWKQSNRNLINANTAARRAARLNATPKWVDTKALKLIYELCPRGQEVDHIIPLRNKRVCGLHVPWNLQYLTPKTNKEKSNKF